MVRDLVNKSLEVQVLYISWITYPQRALTWDMAFPFHHLSFFTILSYICPRVLILNNYSLCQFAYTGARLPLLYLLFDENWLL